MTDIYIYVIIALLPLSALVSVLQVNPYSALVIRAILGAISALVYAIVGAADVALTEALVGTLLAVTLYVITVRSSLVMRLGVLKAKLDLDQELELIGKKTQEVKAVAVSSNNDGLQEQEEAKVNNLNFLETILLKDFKTEQEQDSYLSEVLGNVRKVLNKHHLRLELVEYPTPEALEQALIDKEIHATCTKGEKLETDGELDKILLPEQAYHTTIRVRRLFEIMQPELAESKLTLSYVTVPNTEDKH
ncbi:MAG: DUF4040 domain-containing protein [Xenococcaceae cyanobacterium MO_207.B15]|nr:DUF4040 domain-containing protein [Xenococcaceae cyanobacterium MO_207.B15]